MIKREWKNIFQNNWIMIVLVTIILIPSIYACVFLGSMWDPYGNTGNIPVAVVNNDKRVIYNDSTLAAGEELVKNLEENEAMDFQFMDQEKAEKGLEEGDYYMIITIPTDFSQCATTLLDENPKKMILSYTTNPGTNYIASKMDDSAVNKIKEQVSATITKTYAETIFTQLSTLTTGLSDASNGSQQLSQGMTQLVKGNTTISNNLNTITTRSLVFQEGTENLEVGLKKYIDGVTSAYNGVKELSSNNKEILEGTASLSNGLNEVKKSVDTKLSKGSQSLASGALQLDEGIQTFIDTLTNASSNSQKIITSNTQLNTQLSTIAHKDVNTMSEQELVQFLSNLDSSTLAQLLVNYKKVADGGTTLASTLTSNETSKKLIELQTGANLVCNGAKTLNEGINGNNTIENPGLKGYISQLTTGAESLDEGMIEYTDGVNSLVTGTKQLVDKNDELIEGVSELKAGTQKITDGTQKLLSGSVTLGNGLNTVSNGILQLNTSLKEGVKKAQIDTNDETFDMIASPVETQHKEISIVENNGHAMAPYMMSVALYVAALAFTLMYPIRHGIKETKNAIKYWTSKATVMYTTSTLAAILLITALRIFNGFEPQQLIMTYIFAIITSVAFMSLIILISLTTGYIGEFLLLVFMIINLGGSAGTYPLETSTALYKAIHRFVPYTYTVDGFRKLISMPNATVRTEILILLGIFIVCTLLTILYFHFKNKEDKHLIPEAFESVNEVEN